MRTTKVKMATCVIQQIVLLGEILITGKLTFNLNEGFESYAVKRLREGNDRIYFMPHNSKAVKSFNIQTGRGNKMPKVKHLLGSTKHPGGHECGYVVMRYMKDIIADKEFTFLKKLECEESKQLQHGGSGGASFGSRLY
ncbi:hypothetical protein OROMI_011050 [Orobanche minor]